jgi:hypothetical protein
MLPPLPFAYDAALEPATSRSSAKDSTSAKIQGRPSPPTPWHPPLRVHRRNYHRSDHRSLPRALRQPRGRRPRPNETGIATLLLERRQRPSFANASEDNEVSPGTRRTAPPPASRSPETPIWAFRHACSGTPGVMPTDPATAARMPWQCSTPAPPTRRSAPPLATVHAGCKQKSSSLGAVVQTAGLGATRSRS